MCKTVNSHVELVMMDYCVVDLSLCLFFTQGHRPFPGSHCNSRAPSDPSHPGTTHHPPQHTSEIVPSAAFSIS